MIPFHSVHGEPTQTARPRSHITPRLHQADKDVRSESCHSLHSMPFSHPPLAPYQTRLTSPTSNKCGTNHRTKLVRLYFKFIFKYSCLNNNLYKTGKCIYINSIHFQVVVFLGGIFFLLKILIKGFKLQ